MRQARHWPTLPMFLRSNPRLAAGTVVLPFDETAVRRFPGTVPSAAPCQPEPASNPLSYPFRRPVDQCAPRRERGSHCGTAWLEAAKCLVRLIDQTPPEAGCCCTSAENGSQLGSPLKSWESVCGFCYQAAQVLATNIGCAACGQLAGDPGTDAVVMARVVPWLGGPLLSVSWCAELDLRHTRHPG